MNKHTKLVLALAREARRSNSGALWWAADYVAACLFGRRLNTHGIGRVHAALSPKEQSDG